jgi:ATP dependent DNA ligase domain
VTLFIPHVEHTLPAGFIAPCLPTKTTQLPSGSQWLHEIKHDGFRVIARKDGERVRLYSRPGNDFTRRFPLIVETLERLRSRSCIIDGEAVACDDNGMASFDRIRYRKYDASVDQTPNFGGLGLQTATGPAGTGDDQIEGNGVLHLHFATPVNITGIVTLFDPNHADFGSGFNAATVGSQHFLFCATNNSSCTPSTSETFSLVNTVGMFTSGPFTDFEFAESSDNVEFYVSALTYTAAVPGPIAGAGVPGLVAACAGLWGFARRRRKLVV